MIIYVCNELQSIEIIFSAEKKLCYSQQDSYEPNEIFQINQRWISKWAYMGTMFLLFLQHLIYLDNCNLVITKKFIAMFF